MILLNSMIITVENEALVMDYITIIYHRKLNLLIRSGKDEEFFLCEGNRCVG